MQLFLDISQQVEAHVTTVALYIPLHVYLLYARHRLCI